MKRSKFNLSNYKLLTCDMGTLIPVGLTEVLPGDTIQHATSMLVRAAPLQTPPMHPVKMKVHHWFVPFRLIWEDWEKFITGGPDGMDNSVFPTMTFGATNPGSLQNYLGLPVGFTGATSALPFRAYSLIYNEFYRDQDLQTALTISRASGADITSNYLLQNVCWEKDYFTTARPWEQKGPDISIPFATSAPVVPSGTFPTFDTGSVVTGLRSAAGNGTVYFTSNPADAINNIPFVDSGLVTDLTGATSVNVNDLREAFALQRYEEARARYGSRYTEYLAYLGVRSSDARLQRPEYLGGGTQTLQFSEILQTGSTTADPNGVGQLYGHGIGSVRSNRYRKFFEEHGFVISLAYVLPKTIYANSIPRHWNRRFKEDFWQKELEHIGQQAILNKEVYYAAAQPDGVFGYQDRYDEYRHTESSVAGEFATSTMYDWHFARMFGSEPALNAAFVTADPAVRPFQSQATDTLYIMAYHQMVARRMISPRGNSFIY